MTITATPYLYTRERPYQAGAALPQSETISTHRAVCPTCSRSILIKCGPEAHVFGGCHHFRSLEQKAGEVSVVFDQQ